MNVPWVYKNNIPVVRRVSGGGTVFHDDGNLNYAFITNGQRDSLIDFKKATQPVLDFLTTLGVDARLRGKSDLVINDAKFSGNAGHVYRNRVMHHGTLLTMPGSTGYARHLKCTGNVIPTKRCVLIQAM
jgi:lipoate-protein ligase A